MSKLHSNFAWFTIDILLLVMRSEEIVWHIGLHTIVNTTCESIQLHKFIARSKANLIMSDFMIDRFLLKKVQRVPLDTEIKFTNTEMQSNMIRLIKCSKHFLFIHIHGKL